MSGANASAWRAARRRQPAESNLFPPLLPTCNHH